jgi:RNA polymerase sigma-70 factor (ECF subfamily)
MDVASGDSIIAFDPQSGASPEQLYERQWARSLLDLVMQRLESEYTQQRKQRFFSLLKEFISSETDAKYGDVSEELAMNESAVRMAASRLRKRYRELLRDEIAHTVSNADEVDSEIGHLFKVFQ